MEIHTSTFVALPCDFYHGALLCSCPDARAHLFLILTIRSTSFSVILQASQNTAETCTDVGPLWPNRFEY